MNASLKTNKPIPRVSIGLPVYNGEKFIRSALNSLLAQTFVDFELIISDNASTDKTPEICAEYAARDKRIRYIRQSRNLGPSANFKNVLDSAQAKYFMWAACDDTWASTCVQKWVGILESDDKVVLAFSNTTVFSHISGFLRKDYVYPSLSETKRGRLLMRFWNVNPSLIYGMMPTKVLKSLMPEFYTQPFDYADIYFGYYMALAGRIVVSDEYLYGVGIKDLKRTPYSLTGKRIKVAPFFFRTLKLFWGKLGRMDFCVFSMLLAMQSLGFMRSVRAYSKLNYQ